MLAVVDAIVGKQQRYPNVGDWWQKASQDGLFLKGDIVVIEVQGLEFVRWFDEFGDSGEDVIIQVVFW